ncbi:hypothetical protein TELCIR_17656, partial [Teladorsagia circumcincta]
VSQLDDDFLDGRLSGSVDQISPPPAASTSYKLDSAHLVSLFQLAGGHIAVGYSKGFVKIRCVFSGCNGEVIHMHLLPYSLLALLTVSKPIVNFGFLTKSYLVAFDERGAFSTIRDDKQVSSQSSSPCRIPLLFSTSDFKGLATGGNVMSTCKQNGLYDGIIYVMNKALGDYLSPLEFTHVIRTCADAPIFQSEGRLQRLVENIGRLSMELRNESALVHFLLLISQLLDITGVVTPVEIVEDVVTTLMRMKWQSSSAEFAIVEILKAVPQIDRKAVLRMASSPMRKEICTFIYCGERKFVDLINCYIRDADNEQLAAVNARDCADLVIDCFPNYLLNLRSHTTEERTASYPLLRAAFDIKYCFNF